MIRSKKIQCAYHKRYLQVQKERAIGFYASKNSNIQVRTLIRRSQYLICIFCMTHSSLEHHTWIELKTVVRITLYFNIQCYSPYKFVWATSSILLLTMHRHNRAMKEYFKECAQMISEIYTSEVICRHSILYETWRTFKLTAKCIVKGGRR